MTFLQVPKQFSYLKEVYKGNLDNKIWLNYDTFQDQSLTPYIKDNLLFQHLTLSNQELL